MARSLKDAPPAALPPASDPKTRFELAAERARARHSAEMWAQLGPGERSHAIYEELRLIDAEAALNMPGRP